MARLSKDQIGDRGRYRFKQNEVPIPELSEDEDNPDTVLIRTPSLKQRDEMGTKLPDDPTEWKVDDAALLASVWVVEPQLSEKEWAEFLGDWPGTAFDRITTAFAKLIGGEEEMRRAAGDFQPAD
jgi:hypothetical protein